MLLTLPLTHLPDTTADTSTGTTSNTAAADTAAATHRLIFSFFESFLFVLEPSSGHVLPRTRHFHQASAGAVRVNLRFVRKKLFRISK